MSKNSDADLLLTLRCSSLPGSAFYAGLFLESVISSELLKAEWERTCLKDSAISEALFNGWWQLKAKADEFAATARERGQLLFAFPGSTALQGGTA